MGASFALQAAAQVLSSGQGNGHYFSEFGRVISWAGRGRSDFSVFNIEIAPAIAIVAAAAKNIPMID
jgi:hypothetical protein